MFHLKLTIFPKKRQTKKYILPLPQRSQGRQTNHVAPVEDPACLLSAEGKGVENKHRYPSHASPTPERPFRKIRRSNQMESEASLRKRPSPRETYCRLPQFVCLLRIRRHSLRLHASQKRQWTILRVNPICSGRGKRCWFSVQRRGWSTSTVDDRRGKTKVKFPLNKMPGASS
jgi:hypothetical protein